MKEKKKREWTEGVLQTVRCLEVNMRYSTTVLNVPKILEREKNMLFSPYLCSVCGGSKFVGLRIELLVTFY